MKAHDLTVSLDSWPTFEGDARWWFRIGNSVLASGAAVDVAAGRLAAETAARQYADAIRAAVEGLRLGDILLAPQFVGGKVHAQTTIDGWTYQYKASTNGRAEPLLLWRCRMPTSHQWTGQDAVWHADQIGLATLLLPAAAIPAEASKESNDGK